MATSQNHNAAPPGAASAPAAPATPAAPPAATPAPVWHPLKWSYPFDPRHGDPLDPQTWLYALSQADGGFYPLGANGMFHGGIHFDSGTASLLQQDSGVKVIADGEVVAYRLDSKYPALEYPEIRYADGVKTGKKHAVYSSGFVLVRHKLVLPPAPPPPPPPAPAGAASQPQAASAPHPASAAGAASAATPPAGASPPAPAGQTSHHGHHGAHGTQGAAHTAPSPPPPYNPPPEDVLVFYSLYMHLLDWAGYQDKKHHPMGYWQGTTPYRVSKKAHDQQGPPPSDHSSYPAQATGTWIYAQAQASAQPQAGTSPIGLLPQGCEVNVGPAQGGWVQITRILDNENKSKPLATAVGGARDPHAATGWVQRAHLDAMASVPDQDEVIVLKTPYPVKAGDVVGYLGEYQRYKEAQLIPVTPTNKVNPRALLHVEVFAGAKEFGAFVPHSQARARTLPASGKTQLLLVNQGTRLVKPNDPDPFPPAMTGTTLRAAADDPGGDNLWAKVVPTNSLQAVHHGAAQTLSPVWVYRTDLNRTVSAPIRTWSRFPLQLTPMNGAWPVVDYPQVFTREWLEHSGSLARGRAAEEKASAQHRQQRKWWMVRAGEKSGDAILEHWVCDTDHPGTEWCSPWSWPGFEQTSGKAAAADLLIRNEHAMDHVLEGEGEAFSVKAAEVQMDPLIAKLEKAIGIMTSTDRKPGQGSKSRDVVVPEDLRVALRTPWLAQSLSHLCVEYMSEWADDMAPWEGLLQYMYAEEPLWEAELERIEKLRWWGRVKAGDSTFLDPLVWHVHPIGMVGNFILVKDEFKFTLEMMQHMFPSASADDLQKAIDELNPHVSLYKLDTGLRRNHFFAQVLQEAGPNFHIQTESFNYSTYNLLHSGLFSYFPAHPADAELYGRNAHHPANEQAIANHAYQNVDHNGPAESGDGWRYRGRGMLQVTHKGGYMRFTQWNAEHRQEWPDDANADFVANPDLLSTVKYAVRSAAYFWVTNKLYSRADAGASSSNVDSITRVVDPGLFGGTQTPEKLNGINGRRDNFSDLNAWGGLK